MPEFSIGSRLIGSNSPPFVIAEIGINHDGSEDKAMRMIDDAVVAGCECVKFQTHVIEDEMIPNDVVPANADKTIWDIMSQSALSGDAEARLKSYAEQRGLIYISTPFSRAAADRLRELDVPAFKIGSGECNNYPLIKYVAQFGKPMIISTGMNNVESVRIAVEIVRAHDIPYALLHCTSMYPTPYEFVRLGAMTELADCFPDAVIGLSDHSLTNYPCLGAVALGASILERHFTSDKLWPGPDIEISMDPSELAEIIEGSKAIFAARGGRKEILPEEQGTIDFAYACVVAIEDVKMGQKLSILNIWVKRPGTGEILAKDFERLIGRKAAQDISKNEQLTWAMVQ